MFLGRVVGNVVCTIKNSTLEGKKLLLVQPIDRHGRDKGRVFVAVDAVGAGAGETIYWCRGREAVYPFAPGEPPTEATIVGIVDEISLAAEESEVSYGAEENNQGVARKVVRRGD